jgi:ferredoxin
MGEVEIKFDEGREGVVPVGTYLADAARRMGAGKFDCVETGEHCCQIEVKEGLDLLSPLTAEEKKILTNDERKHGIRVGCYARIEKPGVMTAMVKKKKETVSSEESSEDRDEKYRKEFAELPLEKKIANLVQLETIALGETFAFVINSPFKVFEKIGDVMAEFGFKKEEDQKRRARPAENKTATDGNKNVSTDKAGEKEQSNA